jgi:glycosyltransferase involved in cell wall biosynthesis
VPSPRRRRAGYRTVGESALRSCGRVRILVCASEAPAPPLNGMRLALFELCRRLASRHEVVVLAFRWPDQEGDAPAGVELVALEPPIGGRGTRPFAWLRALAASRPVETVRLTAPMSVAVRRAVRERPFDVAHVTLGSLADVAPALAELPAIVAPLDAWHLNEHARQQGARGWHRLVLKAHERAVRRFTASAYRRYRRAVFVTDDDARAARALDPSLATAVIPNGVDCHHFSPDPTVEAVPGLIVFTGVLHTPANVDAAVHLVRTILPKVRARRPDARVALVGRDPAPAVRALAAAERVEVTGEVPDLAVWLRRAQVYACPMLAGTGIKNKLLEALACGLPCVATPLACQGVAVEDGVQLRIAGEEREFADRLVALLERRDDARALGAAGRRYVLAHHDWEAVARAYERLYAEVSG